MALTTIKELFKDNDNNVTLDAVKNIATGNYIDGSTNVTAGLVTIVLAEVIAQSALAYQAGTNGNYAAVWDKAVLDAVAAGPYYIKYVVAEAGVDAKILQYVEVKERKLS